MANENDSWWQTDADVDDYDYDSDGNWQTYLSTVHLGEDCSPACTVSTRRGSRQVATDRMVAPGHDAARDHRSHRPVGMVNPVDIRPLQNHPAMDSHVPQQEQALRQQQLVHFLRTSMENATLPVNQNLLTDSEGASAWHLARNAVLSGSEYVNRSDPRVVVWDTALRKIISGFLAAAQLKFSDLVRIDLREVCRQSVAAVYGEQAALDMVSVPAAHHSLLHCDDAETLSALRKRQLQHSLAKKGRPARTTTRFGTTVTWEVRIGSVVIPVSIVLLDTGSDLDHIQVTTLEAAWKAATTAELPKETIAVLNITGARSTISRLTERSEITLMPGTPQQMTVYSRLGLMQGSELPTLIIGAPTASRMHMNVDLGLWHVEYTNMPWLANPPRYTLQLQGSQSRRQQSAISALPKSFIPVRYQGLLAVDCADESLPMDCRGLRRRVIARLGGKHPS